MDVRGGEGSWRGRRGSACRVPAGVLLVQILALLFVPIPPHLAAAADVRNDIGDPAVKQRQAQRREGRLHADPVATVAIEEHVPARAAIILVSAVHEGERNGRTISCAREQALATILARVVAWHLQIDR
eukprot:scaffold155373_cov30-Tisochrysis_lutea.AAC.2